MTDTSISTPTVRSYLVTSFYLSNVLLKSTYSSKCYLNSTTKNFHPQRLRSYHQPSRKRKCCFITSDKSQFRIISRCPLFIAAHFLIVPLEKSPFKRNRLSSVLLCRTIITNRHRSNLFRGRKRRNQSSSI